MSDPEASKAGLTVFRGWSGSGYYVWSPFVIKLEFRLRLGNVPYAVAAGSTSAAPKKKIPYVELQRSDEAPLVIGDSSLIVKRMVEFGRLDELHADDDASRRAQDLAMRALLEDKLYFFSMRERWIDNFYAQRDHILSTRPWLVRVVVGSLIHRTVVRTLYGQGTGRHTADEVRTLTHEIWQSIEDLLAASRRHTDAAGVSKQPFWCCDTKSPMEADTALFGFIVSVLVSLSGPESQKLVRGLPAVMDYVGRIHDQYFPDYVKWE